MTASTRILFVPTKLWSRSSFAFTYQVILAAALSQSAVEIIPEGTEHPDRPIGYPLPVLVTKDGPNPSVFITGKAAVQRILDGEEATSLSLEDLKLEDNYSKLATSIFDNDQVDLALFTALNPSSKTIKVLTAGLIKVLLHAGENVPDHTKKWFDDFTSPFNSALNDSFDPLIPERTDRKIKNGIALDLDHSSKKLPRKDCRNVLITAALPYVNNVPHLGNIIGAVLSADVFSRYCRLRGYQTLYICGTDEYGTATETKAMEDKVSCEELCSKYYKLHAEIYEWFGIDTDIFGRSSTPLQTEITHEIFNGLYKNGYFIEQSVEQTYCESCSRFLADRYVEGTCPLCGFNDARGDQCDGCGKLVNPIELKDPRCKICRNTPVVRTSNHLFLDLTKLQPAVENFIETQSAHGGWSANCLAISKAWLHEGLKPRCMTRDLHWGTPVPVTGFEDKVFYVWFDACFGYISITANYTKEWRQWWQCNDKKEEKERPKVELYQFMGKDNVPFHAVIFPGTLLGMEPNEPCPWTLAHNFSTTEFLNYETGKFSKSRGIGVFGNDARDSGIPVSVWRYYLLAVRPETTDSAFSWDDFGARNNNELLANLGNFVSRITKFAMAKFNGKVPGISELTTVEKDFIAKVNGELEEYLGFMEGVHLKSGLKTAMSISSLGNHYLTEAGLDNKLLKEKPERCETIISVALNLAYLLNALLDPFIPATSKDIRTMLNAPLCSIPDTFEVDLLQKGHTLGQPTHLFTRLEETRLAELRARFSGKQVR